MKIYEFLDTPEKWTQGCGARAADGQVVLSNSFAAVCWCLGGAALRCYLWPTGDAFVKLRQRFGSMFEAFGWNDTPGRTYEEVIALAKELDI